MTNDRRAAADRLPLERIVVDTGSGEHGPCLVVLAGLHGDETGGVAALERVRVAIDAGAIPVNGRMLGVLGNVPAIERKIRYVDRDLNRHWWEDEVKSLLAQSPSADGVEDGEMRSLLRIVEGLETDSHDPIVFLDLHSTSGGGLPFSCVPDTISNLRIALEIPIPVVLNLEETVDGPMMGYLSDMGFPGVIVEGGQHDDPRTVDVLESSIWILLAALGCVKRDDVPGYSTYWERLASLCEGLPKALEVKHRYEVPEGEDFQMEPGFEHYARVEKGQLLARAGGRELRSPRRGRVLMPRYEPSSEHGYFITKDVPSLYLAILFLIRWLRLDRIAHWLPGTSREPGNPNRLKIETWVPERCVNLVRLLGWRRLHRGKTHTLLLRRRIRSVTR